MDTMTGGSTRIDLLGGCTAEVEVHDPGDGPPRVIATVDEWPMPPAQARQLAHALLAAADHAVAAT
ncbi:hypothetical protein [Geodermatophilus ruber]|nr:hypothetical protein [Geodermatophilus ruber]